MIDHGWIVDAVGVLDRDSSFSTVEERVGSETQLSFTPLGVARRWLCEQTKSLDGAEQGQRTSTSEEVLGKSLPHTLLPFGFPKATDMQIEFSTLVPGAENFHCGRGQIQL